MWLIIIKKGFLLILILIDTSFFPLAQCSWPGAVQLNRCTICKWAAAVSFFLLWRLKICRRWRRNCRMCTYSINAWTPRVWSSLLVLCCHDLMMVWSMLQMCNCCRGAIAAEAHDVYDLVLWSSLQRCSCCRSTLNLSLQQLYKYQLWDLVRRS